MQAQGGHYILSACTFANWIHILPYKYLYSALQKRITGYYIDKIYLARFLRSKDVEVNVPYMLYYSTLNFSFQLLW